MRSASGDVDQAAAVEVGAVAFDADGAAGEQGRLGKGGRSAEAVIKQRSGGAEDRAVAQCEDAAARIGGRQFKAGVALADGQDQVPFVGRQVESFKGECSGRGQQPSENGNVRAIKLEAAAGRSVCSRTRGADRDVSALIVDDESCRTRGRRSRRATESRCADDFRKSERERPAASVEKARRVAAIHGRR